MCELGADSPALPIEPNLPSPVSGLIAGPGLTVDGCKALFERQLRPPRRFGRGVDRVILTILAMHLTLVRWVCS